MRDGAPAAVLSGGPGRAADPPPAVVMLGWQGTLLRKLRACRAVRQLGGPAGILLELTPELGFARLGIGAPAAAIALEELAAWGVQAVVGVGFAGAIATDLAPGDMVVCAAALRDEGTSHHYLPAARFAWPDPHLTGHLRAALSAAGFGPTWTTDAPYRETVEEVTRYRAEGILTVDMEAAALFTVARVLGVPAASVFCISDVLHRGQWQPHLHSAEVSQALWKTFEAVETCLTTTPAIPGRPATAGTALPGTN